MTEKLSGTHLRIKFACFFPMESLCRLYNRSQYVLKVAQIADALCMLTFAYDKMIAQIL